MTPERIARVRHSFEAVSTQPRALAALFYQELFAESPRLRALFPSDLTSLQGHFEAALLLVIRNLEDLSTIEASLRELGVAHTHWGAKPEDYAFVREALIRAIRASSAEWSERLEHDWRGAITAVCVSMLRGAAAHTGVIAEQMAAAFTVEDDN
jgi:hemoglobin-like flavoprotein